MAELKIKADSGGGTVSFKGPATTTSNAAVQLTLPVDDGTANQYLKTDGSGALSWATVDTSIADDSIVEAKLDIHAAPSGTDKFLGYTSNGMEWAAVPADGIQEATQFHMTTTFQGDASTITNWQETTVGPANSLKTANSAGGGTESSGKFSFPATGFWYVELGAQSRGIDMSRYEQYAIETTENNETSWQTVAFNEQFINDNGTDNYHYVNVFTSCILDVTSISGGTTTKGKFSVDHENNASYTIGHADCNLTYALFIRLADT